MRGQHLSRLRDGLPALVAGCVAALTAYTSSLALMFQAGQAAGLSPAQINSWVWALSAGMAICTIGLSLRYRMPIVVAWSTPGAALLVGSLPGISYPEAIGAFILCALLLSAAGLCAPFARLLQRLPDSLAAALLAGILFRIGSEIFLAAPGNPALVLLMLGCFLLGKRWLPRYAVLLALLAGSLLSVLDGRFELSGVSLQLALPQWTRPAFSWQAAISIGIPLFVVAMASQNLPGLAVLRADGYRPPAGPLIASTGLASLLLAPFGSHGINLAAISAAICTGAEAHADPRKRYLAVLVCGGCYALAALFAATLANLFAALPAALILSLAALALFGSIGNGLQQSMQRPDERDAALITFMLSASGISLLGIGSAFWGLLAGLLSLLILRRRPAAAAQGDHAAPPGRRNLP